LTRLADRGGAAARQVFARAGQRLAHGIAPVIAALNPEVLLVAGEGTAAIVLATPFDRNALAGQQRLQVLARLHGDGLAGADRQL
jgi:predicted NBD/HSP70 family sugar kinase